MRNNFSEEKKHALNKSFVQLRKLGFFAKQSFWCCNSCACSAVPDDALRYVFYHKQDKDTLNRTGMLYLTYGTDDEKNPNETTHQVGKTIVKVLNENGLVTEWDGDSGKRILVNLKKAQ